MGRFLFVDFKSDDTNICFSLIAVYQNGTKIHSNDNNQNTNIRTQYPASNQRHEGASGSSDGRLPRQHQQFH